MSESHFNIYGIEHDFWRKFMITFAEKYSEEEAEWLYLELYNRSGGEVPWLSHKPIRVARDKAIKAGEEINEHLSSRQKRRIRVGK